MRMGAGVTLPGSGVTLPGCGPHRARYKHSQARETTPFGDASGREDTFGDASWAVVTWALSQQQ